MWWYVRAVVEGGGRGGSADVSEIERARRFV